MCISGSNFWKKCIFWKDFFQASKPGRGRELTKNRPYISIYIRLCKFCHSPSTWDTLIETITYNIPTMGSKRKCRWVSQFHTAVPYPPGRTRKAKALSRPVDNPNACSRHQQDCTSHWGKYSWCTWMLWLHAHGEMTMCFGVFEAWSGAWTNCWWQPCCHQTCSSSRIGMPR